MRGSTRNRPVVNKEEMIENILSSMIASFKIEKINISEKTAQEIYRKVKIKLKKED